MFDKQTVCLDPLASKGYSFVTRFTIRHLQCSDALISLKNTKSEFFFDFKHQLGENIEVEAATVCQAARYISLFLENFHNFRREITAFCDNLILSIEYSQDPQCPSACDGCRKFSIKASHVVQYASKEVLFRILCDVSPSKIRFLNEIVATYKKTTRIGI